MTITFGDQSPNFTGTPQIGGVNISEFANDDISDYEMY